MRVHRSTSKYLLGAVVILPIVMAGCSSTTPKASNGSTGSTGSAAPITIAYITDLTGEGASENATSPAGFDARIDLQNSEGGVNGHKLVPLVIDDQTSPSEIAICRSGGGFQGVRHRLAEPPVLPCRQVPAGGGGSRDGLL